MSMEKNWKKTMTFFKDNDEQVIDKEGLENAHRQKMQEVGHNVRHHAVNKRKEELANIISDLESSFAKVSGENQQEIFDLREDLRNSEKDAEKILVLQQQLSELLQIDPRKCSDDNMATMANKIEFLRRSIIYFQLNSEKKNGKNKFSELKKISSKEILKFGLFLSLPIISAIIIGFLVVASVLFIVFG